MWNDAEPCSLGQKYLLHARSCCGSPWFLFVHRQNLLFGQIATWLHRIAPYFLSAESADILVSIEILVEAASAGASRLNKWPFTFHIWSDLLSNVSCLSWHIDAWQGATFFSTDVECVGCEGGTAEFAPAWVAHANLKHFLPGLCTMGCGLSQKWQSLNLFELLNCFMLSTGGPSMRIGTFCTMPFWME